MAKFDLSNNRALAAKKQSCPLGLRNGKWEMGNGEWAITNYK